MSEEIARLKVSVTGAEDAEKSCKFWTSWWKS